MQVNGTHGLVDKQPNQEGGQSSTFETSFIPLELTGSSRLRYNALDSVFAYHLDCVLGLGKVLPAIGVEISSRVQLKDKLRLPMSQKFAEYGFSFDEYHQQIFGTMQQQLSTEGKTQYFGESWLSRVTRVTCRKLCELIGGPIYCMDSGVQRALNELEAFHFILGSVDSSFTVAEMTDQKTSQKARMLLPNPVYRMLATYYSPDDPFLLRQSKPGCQHSIRLYERLLQASVNFGPSKDSKRTLAYRMGMAILEDPLMRKYWYRMLQSPRVMRRMGLRRSTYVAHIEKCVENFGKEHVFFR
ncbi:hypothetical protein SARC_02506 [Sphaeroforma arctica JP610]|uniref:Uncharacterized protein n=1 Tax=Sphaeroforma arctica JP610 TaxID=667725 RepID=A0A0L0G8T2_9EUKA|nr:hypothetical protein SARC_02506 [Sphaeroforma arctica JP610]KNC85324.1 hypothetical protein SARC_02506 [Sphaeroforma arctica JP610]|eukprot:XP_014159226.1 hypothetical protein SARC_02506 [Sphaeroforma arctica JP610]